MELPLGAQNPIRQLRAKRLDKKPKKTNFNGG
jgi:hypothetical protein